MTMVHIHLINLYTDLGLESLIVIAVQKIDEQLKIML